MLTVKRNDSNETTSGNIALLEREDVLNTELSAKEQSATYQSQADALEQLLNFDQFAVTTEDKASTVIEAQPVVEEDLIPSSTTMQFQGQSSAQDFYNNGALEERFSFSLNAKGKFLIGLYSAIVAVIVALIIINTGILNRFSARINEKEEKISNLKTEYNQIVDDIDNVTSDETIKNEAEKNGMVSGD